MRHNRRLFGTGNVCEAENAEELSVEFRTMDRNSSDRTLCDSNDRPEAFRGRVHAINTTYISRVKTVRAHRFHSGSDTNI